MSHLAGCSGGEDCEEGDKCCVLNYVESVGCAVEREEEDKMGGIMN
jgi:hypothetical protein